MFFYYVHTNIIILKVFMKNQKIQKYVKCIKQAVPNGNLEALKISYKYLKKDFILCNGDTFINLKD